MAYLLGSDVDVFMTTEHKYFSVSCSATGVGTKVSGTSDAIGNSDGSPYSLIPPRTFGLSGNSRVSDVIGIDFTPGTRSEDLQFFGKNTGLNAEIKKEYVVTLTRKVTDNTFDQLFNYPARNGVYATGGADSGDGATVHDGLTTSKKQNFGYRIHLRLADTDANVLGGSEGEIVTIRNACITAHTKTLDANNAQEETVEFYSYVQPVLTSGLTTSNTAVTALADI